MKNNVIFFIMDAVSYEQFEEADTPFIDSHTNRKMRSYSGATWTLPSMAGILHGVIPSSEEITYYEHLDTWITPESVSYKKRGYKTIAVSANPLFSRYSIPDPGFHIYEQEKGFDLANSGERVVETFLEHYEHPTFGVMLLIDTHQNYNGIDYEPENTSLEKLKEYQRRGITYLDKQFDRLYNEINEPTEFYIFSDHGELFRGDKHGHNPKAQILDDDDRKSCKNEGDLLEVFTVEVIKDGTEEEV